MPHTSRLSQADVPTTTSYGQVIEYIQDRLYLASYTHPPNAHTPFPYPSKSSRSPSKRSASRSKGPTPVSDKPVQPTYFSIDDSLLYNAFHADFGPLHIGHLYRFAVMLHEVLGDQETDGRPVVFWSNADSRSRAKAACILACYMVLIQNWPSHLALAPIAQMDPPCMPFRDAGYSQADYGITIQDVVYGVWKAKEEKLCGLNNFSLEEYEKYERVDMGDFNWVTPDFLAFASPQHRPTHVIGRNDPLYASLPRTVAAVQQSDLPGPFRNVLTHFSERGIGLVVRLNSELYSPSYFEALGIKHLDMIFDDGTCPPLSLVRRFINLAHEMIISKGKGVAVHCKAGLGRTGCLIGAYLIYRHGFTANEVIAFMRFMRPGMVVGPQQHWLHLNQGTFREWWLEDKIRKEMLAQMAPTTPTKSSFAAKSKPATNGQTFTPPPNGNGTSKRSALGEITQNERHSSSSFANSIGVQDENLPAPTPGQPRKTSKIYGGGSPFRKQYHQASTNANNENEPFEIRPDAEVVSMQHSTLAQSDESEDVAMDLLSSAQRKSQSPVSRSGKRRAVSCTTTTTTTTKWDVDASDTENRYIDGEMRDRDLVDIKAEEFVDREILGQSRRPKTPSSKAGSGVGGLSVGKRSSPSRRSTEGKTSVRKTSGRVGSVGTQGVRTRAS